MNCITIDKHIYIFKRIIIAYPSRAVVVYLMALVAYRLKVSIKGGNGLKPLRAQEIKSQISPDFSASLLCNYLRKLSRFYEFETLFVIKQLSLSFQNYVIIRVNC